MLVQQLAQAQPFAEYVSLDEAESLLGKRLAKTPKVSLNDTGLLGDFLAMDRKRLTNDSLAFGQMLENFVVMELRKQQTWSATRVQMFHFRDHKNHEVDIVLENRAGEIVGIEVKATASPSASDFKGLNQLARSGGQTLHPGRTAPRRHDGDPFYEWVIRTAAALFVAKLNEPSLYDELLG